MKTKFVVFKTPTHQNPGLFHMRLFVTPMDSRGVDLLAEHLRVATLEWFTANGMVENLTTTEGTVTTIADEIKRKN